MKASKAKHTFRVERDWPCWIAYLESEPNERWRGRTIYEALGKAIVGSRKVVLPEGVFQFVVMSDQGKVVFPIPLKDCPNLRASLPTAREILTRKESK